jgi:3-oxoacyl-[acyl-carrier protein] reductase
MRMSTAYRSSTFGVKVVLAVASTACYRPRMSALTGKIALVTGAGSGLGREIALTFARSGGRVAVNDLRASAAGTVHEELAPLGAALPCGPLIGDVSDSAQVNACFATLRRTTADRLDVLVNNAGYADNDPETQAQMARHIGELTSGTAATTALDTTRRMSDERWRRMIAVHLDGTFFCSRAALELMTPRREGRIINIASIAGTTGIAGAAHYSAAKGGIIGFTRALAREVGGQGILVNAIAPGYIDTPLLDVLGEQRAMQSMLIAMQTVLGRLGEAREVAETALFLAGPGASYFTGQVLSPNGGLVI